MRGTYPYVDVPYPVVMAHQGQSDSAPSNTLVAFELAVRSGTDILETDMHWTKDGFIVLCHNSTVDATSNGNGAIENLTLAELKGLDFGYQFTPDGGRTFPFRGKGVQIPTLKEALAAFPDVRFNIDVKPFKPRSLQQLIREIYEMGAEERVLIASFHHHVLQTFRSMTKTIATSASVRETAWFCATVWSGLGHSGALPYCALQVPMAPYGLPVVGQRFVEAAHKRNVKVHVWTIDDEHTMETLLQMGVDGIVTNCPETAVSVRKKYLPAPLTPLHTLMTASNEYIQEVRSGNSPAQHT